MSGDEGAVARVRLDFFVLLNQGEENRISSALFADAAAAAMNVLTGEQRSAEQWGIALTPKDKDEASWSNSYQVFGAGAEWVK